MPRHCNGTVRSSLLHACYASSLRTHTSHTSSLIPMCFQHLLPMKAHGLEGQHIQQHICEGYVFFFFFFKLSLGLMTSTSLYDACNAERCEIGARFSIICLTNGLCNPPSPPCLLFPCKNHYAHYSSLDNTYRSLDKALPTL